MLRIKISKNTDAAESDVKQLWSKCRSCIDRLNDTKHVLFNNLKIHLKCLHCILHTVDLLKKIICIYIIY